jgi:hypothetical protein
MNMINRTGDTDKRGYISHCNTINSDNNIYECIYGTQVLAQEYVDNIKENNCINATQIIELFSMLHKFISLI